MQQLTPEAQVERLTADWNAMAALVQKLSEQINALDAKVEKLDRLVYRLFKRLGNPAKEAQPEGAADPEKDDLAF